MKDSIDFSAVTEKALNRYVEDKANVTLSADDKSRAELIKQTSPADRFLPRVFPNAPLSSSAVNEFMRDAKLRIGMLASQARVLEGEIHSSNQSLLSQLNDLSHQVRSIESDIKEQEIRKDGKYSTVHYNAFNRPIDLQAGKEMLDPKTGQAFLKHQKLRLFPGTGLTLPVKTQEKINIREIELLDEECDVGDSLRPIVETPANNLLEPGKTFRYVLARKVYDESGRLYNYTENTIKLHIQLGYCQLVNQLVIRPASSSPVYVKALEYINEANEVVSISLDQLVLETDIVLILEPVRATSFLVTLAQKAPIEISEIQISSLIESAINQTLEGNDFPSFFPTAEVLQCKVFDFSLQSIELKLCVYEQEGWFQSKLIKVEGPLSLRVAVETQSMSISNVLKAYGSSYYLPEDTVLYETYLRVQLQDADTKVQSNTLIPVPNSSSAQIEMLPLTGGVSPFSFIPDLFYDATRLFPISLIKLGYLVYIVFDQPHGIATGTVYTDRVEAIGGSDIQIVSSHWVALDTVSLVLKRDDNIFEAGIFDTSHTPRIQFLRYLDSNPIHVYAEENELTLGTDYVYSIDGGETYYDRHVTKSEFQAQTNIHAGDFLIKVLDPLLNQYHWCSYKRLNKQFLDAGRLFRLRGSSILLDPRYHSLNGHFQTILVLRSDSVMPYLSPVIRNYKLKVREHEL